MLAVVATLDAGCSHAPAAGSSAEMDRDLMEITVPQLEALYRTRKYTVTDVVRWHIARVRKYNSIYGAVQNLDERNALAAAAREDAEAKSARGLLWGVPIVTKANTSIKGLVTTDGWSGYQVPGHELIAPKDATIVARLRAAGAIIIGQTNMPDFAASDTNRSTAFGRTGNAYDVRFSPGGSSGGTVTAITSNFAIVGNGTDTGNSIRMPAATSSVVGVFPTRGLVSIAGIAPLDWLLDNTGPIARDVTDAAIALSVMAGEDPLDPRTGGSAARAQPGPYTRYLNTDALKGKRFGVPACVLTGAGIPFQGMPESADATEVKKQTEAARLPLRPETREAFMKALDGLRAAGATVIFDDSILGDSFAATIARVGTVPYIREGTDKFLSEFRPGAVSLSQRLQQGGWLAFAAHNYWRRSVAWSRPGRSEAADHSGGFRDRSEGRRQCPVPAAKGARYVQRNARPPAPGWIRLSGGTDATS